MPNNKPGWHGRILHPPALSIAKRRNLQLMPRTRWLFWAGLGLPAAGVLFLMILLPVSLLTHPGWIAAVVVATVALLFLRTKAGYFALGPAVGFLVGGVALTVAGRAWLGALAVVLLSASLWASVRYSKAANQLVPLATEANHWGCSITFLRPFDESHAQWARNLLLPLLNGYGHVTHVTDGAFESAEYLGTLSMGYQRMSEEVLGRNDLTDVERRMFDLVKAATGGDMLHGQQLSDDEWKGRVKELLEKTDVAVIDLSRLSPNLLWEVRTSYETLPPERVVLITSSDLADESRALLETIVAA